MPTPCFRPSASWKEGPVMVAWEGKPNHRKKFDAKLYGGVAVHNGVDTGKFAGGYVVAVSSIGYALTAVATETDAMRVGETLWNEGCLGLRLRDPESIKRNLPKWIGEWCIACRKAGKYLDPKPYKEGSVA